LITKKSPQNLRIGHPRESACERSQKHENGCVWRTATLLKIQLQTPILLDNPKKWVYYKNMPTLSEMTPGSK
jgi:hypothetical protein